MKTGQKIKVKKIEPGPCITISRQTGAGADVVSELLAEYLEQFNTSNIKWTIFYKNLIEKVIQDHYSPDTLKKSHERRYYRYNFIIASPIILAAGYDRIPVFRVIT